MSDVLITAISLICTATMALEAESPSPAGFTRQGLMPYQRTAGQETQVGPVDTEKQARQLAQEMLRGKRVTIRFYNDYKHNPRAYRNLDVLLNGLEVSPDAIRATLAQNRIDKSMNVPVEQLIRDNSSMAKSALNRLVEDTHATKPGLDIVSKRIQILLGEFAKLANAPGRNHGITTMQGREQLFYGVKDPGGIPPMARPLQDFVKTIQTESYIPSELIKSAKSALDEVVQTAQSDRLDIERLSAHATTIRYARDEIGRSTDYVMNTLERAHKSWDYARSALDTKDPNTAVISEAIKLMLNAMQEVQPAVERMAKSKTAACASLDRITEVIDVINPDRNGTLLVIVADDQKEPTIAALLQGRGYTLSLRDLQPLSIWPVITNDQRYQWCIFKDAAKEHIGNVLVELFLSTSWCTETTQHCASIGKAMLDKDGRLEIPRFEGPLAAFSFIVHHPDYGQIPVRLFTPKLEDRYFICHVQVLSKEKWCVFTDALGSPIPNATVEIYRGRDWDKIRPALYLTAKLDAKGLLKPPESNPLLREFSFVVSEPNYGIALAEPAWNINILSDELLTNCRLPLVRAETEESSRSIWGVVVDPNGKAIPGAIVGCAGIIAPGGGQIVLPRQRYASNVRLAKVLTDSEGRFAMYLPIEPGPNEPLRRIPPLAKYSVLVDAPKEMGLEQYWDYIPCGQETTITMRLARPDPEKVELIIENDSGPVTDPCMLEQVKIAIKTEHGIHGGPYIGWMQRKILPRGFYSAEAVWSGMRYLSEPVEVTGNTHQAVLKLMPVGSDEITYCGRVVNGITGEPIYDAAVMEMPSLHSFDLSKLENGQRRLLSNSIGPELNPDNPLFDLFSDNFKRKITRSDSNGHFRINLSITNRPVINSLVAVKKDFLGAQQRLTQITPPEQSQPNLPIERQIEFKQDHTGCAELPDMKLFPAGIVIVDPNVPIGGIYNRPRVSFYWATSPQDTTAWLKDLRRTPRDSNGGSTFYKHDLIPNMEQTVYVPAGVELKLKIIQILQSERGPVIIQAVRLEQGQVLNLGQVEFPPTVKVAVRVTDSTGKPVEGVAVSYSDKEHSSLHTRQKPITNEAGIAWFNVPFNSKGQFEVSYSLGGLPEEYIKESTPYQVSGPEDTGKEFTFVLSDEMIQRLSE